SWIPTITTWIFTLSLHDALPILLSCLYINRHSPASSSDSTAVEPGRGLACSTLYSTTANGLQSCPQGSQRLNKDPDVLARSCARSEEHTSELQSRFDLVCRLLLE